MRYLFLIYSIFIISSCNSYKKIDINDITKIEIMHEHYDADIGLLFIRPFDTYRWEKDQLDNVHSIIRRAKRLRQGMSEQEVINTVKPIYVSDNLNDLIKKYKSPDIKYKDLYFNDPFKDLIIINEICYEKNHSDIVEIKIKIPLSKKDKYPKLQKNGSDLELTILIHHGDKTMDQYKLPISDGIPNRIPDLE